MSLKWCESPVLEAGEASSSGWKQLSSCTDSGIAGTLAVAQQIHLMFLPTAASPVKKNKKRQRW